MALPCETGNLAVPDDASSGHGDALLLPVATGAEALAFDQAAQASGIPGRVLMESAGRAAADCVQALLQAWAPARSNASRGVVVVLAGAGNNGGDGVVLARTLHSRGVPVRLWSHPHRPDPDPLLHGHDVPRLGTFPGEAHALDDGENVRPALFVDALLGTGLTEAPREAMGHRIATLARVARALCVPVVSLDVPSGVLADTGEVPGAEAGVDLHATVTLTFGALKRGLLMHPGRARAGRILLLEMGFPPWHGSATSARLLTGAWARGTVPVRPPVTHKRAEGCLLLVAGGAGMGGAALLAARAALRTGVGLLRVACHPDHRAAIHAAVPEAVLPAIERPGVMDTLLAQADAVVAGPGMGTDPGELPTQSFLAALSRVGGASSAQPCPPLVLDADALTLLGTGDLVLPTEPEGAEKRDGVHLLTPHPGEMARIHPAGRGKAADQQAREVAQRYQAVCLLKGAPSVVAAAGAHAHWISASGGSAFAAGGMGDVLAGVAGALMARGVLARDAAGLALHLTGRGADHCLSEPDMAGDALLPSDLVEALPGVLNELATHPAPPAASTTSGETGLPPSVLLDLAPAR